MSCRETNAASFTRVKECLKDVNSAECLETTAEAQGPQSLAAAHKPTWARCYSYRSLALPVRSLASIRELQRLLRNP